MAVQRTLIGNIKGPKGDKGDTGDTGARGAGATVTIGSVTTTAYGGNANVTNSGTATDAVLDFVLPQGAPGETVTDMQDLTLSSMTQPSVQFPTPSVGDDGKTLFGKITKWFSDAYSLIGTKLNIANLVNGYTQTTAGTHALDAAAGKSLYDLINTKATSVTSVTVTNTARCTIVKFGNSGLTLCLFSVVSQCTVNLRPYISYVYAAFAQGNTTNNYNNASIIVAEGAQVVVDPNRGETTKYSAWCAVFGVSV